MSIIASSIILPNSESLCGRILLQLGSNSLHGYYSMQVTQVPDTAKQTCGNTRLCFSSCSFNLLRQCTQFLVSLALHIVWQVQICVFRAATHQAFWSRLQELPGWRGGVVWFLWTHEMSQRNEDRETLDKSQTSTSAGSVVSDIMQKDKCSQICEGSRSAAKKGLCKLTSVRKLIPIFEEIGQRP